MLTFIARRIVMLIPLLLVISFISFGLYQLQPGDPVKSFIDRSLIDNPAEIERVRHSLGLDQHWTIQYVKWMSKVVQGDLGRSYITNQQVTQRLGNAIPVSLRLTVTAFLFAFTAAVAIGVVSATRRYSLLDQATTLFGFAGIAVPNFFLGLMLMLLFAIKLRLLPVTGLYTYGHEGEFFDGLKHMIMPVFCLAINEIASTSRYVRSSMLEVIRSDFIRTARSKGLPERIITYKHALRNALMPVITVLGLGLPGFIGGSLVIEKLFALPGMGRVTVDAVFQKDYPVIMGANILFSLATVLGNLIADVMYAVVDPRVKFS